MENQPALTDETRISRSSAVLTAEVDGEIVMMSIEKGRYFGLDDIGSQVWNLIDTPCTFGELVDRLLAQYDADRDAIAGDVRGLLLSMAERDVVRFS